jgi:transposase-like protein
VDGIYVKAGIGKEKAALLIVIVGTSDGQKKIIMIEVGHRESKESWGGCTAGFKKARS